MKPEKIAIVGAGGFGREVFELLDRARFLPVGFIDRTAPGDPTLPAPVLGNDDLISELMPRAIASCLCVALGNPRHRRRVSDLARAHGIKQPAIIHSLSLILASTAVGDGVVIFPGVIVTSNCRIGRGALLNSGATLGHDVDVGEYANIGPGVHLAGHVKIGAGAVIGIGASVRENIRIGDGAVIGAGSVVVKDVEPGVTAYGVPARAR